MLGMCAHLVAFATQRGQKQTKNGHGIAPIANYSQFSIESKAQTEIEIKIDT